MNLNNTFLIFCVTVSLTENVIKQTLFKIHKTKYVLKFCVWVYTRQKTLCGDVGAEDRGNRMKVPKSPQKSPHFQNQLQIFKDYGIGGPRVKISKGQWGTG